MADRHRLVVVDDEPELRAMVAEYLGRHGFVVHTAANGAELDACVAQAELRTCCWLERQHARRVTASRSPLASARQRRAHPYADRGG